MVSELDFPLITDINEGSSVRMGGPPWELVPFSSFRALIDSDSISTNDSQQQAGGRNPSHRKPCEARRGDVPGDDAKGLKERQEALLSPKKTAQTNG